MKEFKKSNDFLEHALEFEKLFCYYQFMQLSLWASGDNVIVTFCHKFVGIS